MHLSEPTEHTPPTVDPKVNYGLQVTRSVSVDSSIEINAPLWLGMLILGEDMHILTLEVCTKSVHFPLSFTVNLKHL